MRVPVVVGLLCALSPCHSLSIPWNKAIDGKRQVPHPSAEWSQTGRMSPRHGRSIETALPAKPLIDDDAVTPSLATGDESNRYDMSTLTLLEHINLNVPNHEFCLDFYVGLLGCGLDPRKAMNVQSNKTIWVNMGASQVHLPHASVAQCIPGRIGLRVNQWHEFAQRVTEAEQQPNGCIQDVQRGRDARGIDYIELTDRYQNVFYCRPHQDPLDTVDRPMRAWRQPIIAQTENEKWGETARLYGRPASSKDDGTVVESACSGVDYVEFACPRGTAARIALFYDSVLDATVTVLNDNDVTADTVAVIGIGQVDSVTGQADQALLFRETNQPIPPYDGHHIALYVGASAADFDQAYRNCEMAGVVWVNPRFSDQATTLPLARHFQQFRFKNIIDMETGETIFELEHEMRSLDHEAWPGKYCVKM